MNPLTCLSLLVLAIGTAQSQSIVSRMLALKECEDSMINNNHVITDKCTKPCNPPNTVCAIDLSVAFQGSNSEINSNTMICVSLKPECTRALGGTPSTSGGASGGASGSASASASSSGSTSGSTSRQSILDRFNSRTAAARTPDARCTGSDAPRFCFGADGDRQWRKFSYKSGQCTAVMTLCSPKAGLNLFATDSECKTACP